jgi:hypothetical protein
MSIQCLGQRLAWISEHIPANLVGDFEKVFRTLWAEWRATSLPHVNLSDSLFVHLMYALFRHRNWCRTEVFSTVLVEAIAAEYPCDRDFIRSMVFRFIDLVDSEEKIERKSDKEFLLYVLIQATSPVDESHVAEEIGLGREILVKLKGAANSAGRHDASDGHYVFLPEIDDTFCQILKDLTRELKRGTWVLDAYRLKFQLLEMPAPWKAIIAEIGAEWLLRTLTVMGKSAGMSEGEWLEQANEKVGVMLFADGIDQLQELLTQLERRQLIYPIANEGRGRKAGKKWHLTSLGQEFTANMFAEECLAEGEISEEQMLAMNGHWQVALIRKFPQKSLGTVLKVLSSTRPLNSESYFPAVMKLRDEIDHDTLSQILQMRIRCSGTPGVRAAACRASVAMKENEGVLDLLL